MALEIEDGTGKANAQTYVGATEVREFAAQRGVTLPEAPTDPSDFDPVEGMLISAMDYIESTEPRMKGKRTYPERQALSYPRSGVRVGCAHDALPDDAIPANLAAAQCQAVLIIHAGIDLMPVVDPNARLVKRRKTDVLETEYFGPGDLGAEFGQSPKFPAVDTLMQPLLRLGSGTTAPAWRV